MSTTTSASGLPSSTCCGPKRGVRFLLAAIGMVGAMVAVMIGAAILGFGMNWPLP